MEPILAISLLFGAIFFGAQQSKETSKPRPKTKMEDCATLCETGTVQSYKYCKCRTPNFGE